MAQFTIPQYIVFGKITIALMGNYNASGALFGARILVPQSPVLVAIVTDALQWEYERLLAASDLLLPDTIGINNVDSLLINSIDKFLV